MPVSTFAELGVPASLEAVLSERDIITPTPIQAATLPDSLAGRDVLGRGRTGSGKTYAFLLPVIARLLKGRRAGAKRPRALILAPTRELAGQILEAAQPLAAAGRLSTLAVFGGVNQNPQVRALAAGVDLLVACPGRLEDLMGQGHVSLDAVEIVVLDEADHMADLGFLPGVRRILRATPQGGQRLLFSATLDRGVDVIAKTFLHDPVTHHADSPQSPISTMSHHVLHVDKDDRVSVVADLAAAPGRTVVFTRTKHGAKKLAKQLNAVGVPAVELHGNLAQGARTRNLDAFHSGAASTLVATDIAARGIHVDDVGLVIHADPPVEHKAYLHRSGRTARAGASGTVVTLMLDEQVRDVRALTKAAGIKPTTTRVNPTHALLRELAPGERVFAEPGTSPVAAPPQQQRAGGRGGAGRSENRSEAGSSAPGGRGRGRGGRGRGRGQAGEGVAPAARTPRQGGRRGQGGQSGPGAQANGQRPAAPNHGGEPRRSAAAPAPSGRRSPLAPPRRAGAADFSSRSSAGRRGR
ncbi:DEAD/DEAH box helicase [Agilicoccus flavus]|uniref:DEAD/DEAH box helicase n=1 Tax=Agilicoccus flavus TaxID=2775968 RepID=UPI001CF686F9|nr:DEAD/DEAH box helicase [Agilicoccus flavus]